MRSALVGIAVSVVFAIWGSTGAIAVCGDDVVDAGEDCDVGGTCIGGPAAGQFCQVGDTTCTGGTCTTFGGKGCAANCTVEHDVPYALIPAVLDGLSIAPGTSGVEIISDFLSIPLPLGPACSGGDNPGASCASAADCPGGTCLPSEETLTVGMERNGKIPVVVKASSVRFWGIPLPDLACGCVRSVAAKTCGGTFFEPDGKTLSPNCTPGFSSGDPCADKPPCAFVHGEGNTAAGLVGCDGLDGINLFFEQDSGASGGSCAAPNTCPPVLTLSGHGGPGSALVFHTLGITAALGNCTGSDPSVYGPDGIFCTEDDPPGGIISIAGSLPATTGSATVVVHNANSADDRDLGPLMAWGEPFDCCALEGGSGNSSAVGGGLVGGFSFVHLDTVGDVAVTAQLFAAGFMPNPECGFCEGCVGDCDGSGEVTVDEIVTLINIALGTAPPSVCSEFAHCGLEFNITLVIQAVNRALTQC